MCSVNFIRASYILCVYVFPSSSTLLPLDLWTREVSDLFVSGPNPVLLHCWEYGRPLIHCSLESLILKPSVLILGLWNQKAVLTYFYLFQLLTEIT